MKIEDKKMIKGKEDKTYWACYLVFGPPALPLTTGPFLSPSFIHGAGQNS
jgi:hypothetical protein